MNQAKIEAAVAAYLETCGIDNCRRVPTYFIRSFGKQQQVRNVSVRRCCAHHLLWTLRFWDSLVRREIMQIEVLDVGVIRENLPYESADERGLIRLQ